MDIFAFDLFVFDSFGDLTALRDLLTQFTVAVLQEDPDPSIVLVDTPVVFSVSVYQGGPDPSIAIVQAK